MVEINIWTVVRVRILTETLTFDLSVVFQFFPCKTLGMQKLVSTGGIWKTKTRTNVIVSQNID